MGVASIFGIFAATYYWFPKMFGRMMNESLATLALLVHVRRHLRDLHAHALSGHGRSSRGATRNSLSCLSSRLDSPCRNSSLTRRFVTIAASVHLLVQPVLEHEMRQEGQRQPVGSHHSRVDHRHSASPRQFRRAYSGGYNGPTSTACRAPARLRDANRSHDFGGTLDTVWPVTPRLFRRRAWNDSGRQRRIAPGARRWR